MSTDVYREDVCCTCVRRIAGNCAVHEIHTALVLLQQNRVGRKEISEIVVAKMCKQLVMGRKRGMRNSITNVGKIGMRQDMNRRIIPVVAPPSPP